MRFPQTLTPTSYFCPSPKVTLPQTLLKYPLAYLVLDMVHGVLQLLGNGLTPQGLHVKVVGLCWKDQESHHRILTVGLLKTTKLNIK